MRAIQLLTIITTLDPAHPIMFTMVVRDVEKGEERGRGAAREMLHVTIGTAATMVTVTTVGHVTMHIGDLVDFYTMILALSLLCVCHVPHVRSGDIPQKCACDHFTVRETDVCCEKCIQYHCLSVQKYVL